MSILVTGGTGYIGSHTVVELLKDKQYCEDKNEAITLIQNYFSSKITNALTKYIVYNNNDLENIESFLNLIK